MSERVSAFEGKYIIIMPNIPKERTLTWGVSSRSSGDFLGMIEWYAPWRQYCFSPDEGTVFSRGCMAEIMKFIEDHKNERREASPA